MPRPEPRARRLTSRWQSLNHPSHLLSGGNYFDSLDRFKAVHALHRLMAGHPGRGSRMGINKKNVVVLASAAFLLVLPRFAHADDDESDGQSLEQELQSDQPGESSSWQAPPEPGEAPPAEAHQPQRDQSSVEAPAPATLTDDGHIDWDAGKEKTKAQGAVAKAHQRLQKVRAANKVVKARETQAERDLHKTDAELDSVLRQIKKEQLKYKKNLAKAKQAERKLAASQRRLVAAKRDLRRLRAQPRNVAARDTEN